jgi:Dolichyl-phosphate-mannose-protein mannosyltransferase
MISFTHFLFHTPHKRFLSCLMVCGLVLRLALMLRFGNPEKPEMYEMGVIASSMLHGNGYAMHWLTYIPLEPVRKAMVESHTPPPYQSAWQPPLQTYIVYGAFQLFGETPQAASILMLMNVLWSSFIPLLVYRITLLLGTSDADMERPARISAIIATFFLPAAYAVITYSGSSLYQLVFLLFFWMLLLALRRQKTAYLLAAGVVAGVQMLLRSEFLAIGIFMILGTGIIAGVQANTWAKSKDVVIATGIACALALAVISPWMLRNYAVFGKIVPIVSRPWFEIWRGNNLYATGCEWKENTSERCSVLADTALYADLTRKFDALPYDNTFEIRANALLQQEAQTFVRTHPAETLVLAGKKMLFLWIHDLYNPQSRNVVYIFSMLTVSILIWCGFYALLWQHRAGLLDGAVLLYAAYLLFYTAIFMLTFVLPRYRIYVFSGALPLTGLGLLWLWERLHNFPRQQ